MRMRCSLKLIVADSLLSRDNLQLKGIRVIITALIRLINKYVNSVLFWITLKCFNCYLTSANAH